MALVAYDNSDSSEYEDDENDSAPVVILNPKSEIAKEVSQPTTSQTVTNGNDEFSPAQVLEGRSLFNLLPSSTKKATVIEEEDDEFLHKKETATIKPKAKITVPSLSDFRDVEDRPAMARPKASNVKKSGLLSMLPQPRNAGMKTTSLIPNVLTKKPAPLVPTSIKKNTPLPSPMKKAKTEVKGFNTSYSDDSDNDEDETTDFFSINKPVDIAPIENVPIDIDMEPTKTVIEKKPAGIESYFKKDVPQHVDLQPEYSEQNDNVSEYAQDSASYSTEYAAPESSGSNNDVLDDEAIRQLIGSRAKRRKEDIQIVDVNQQEVLGDSKEWLLKGLMDDTTKRVSSSKKTGHEPSAQQRRKHQITYLAHQAKANEAELQNQWANSRMSKRKTQSKYGF